MQDQDNFLILRIQQGRFGDGITISRIRSGEGKVPLDQTLDYIEYNAVSGIAL